MLPIYQRGRFRPVDLFSTATPRTLQLEAGTDGREWIVAAGLNWNNRENEKGLDLGLLNLTKGVQYHAFDVFKQKYIGLATPGTVLGPINAHGVLLVNITAGLGRPQIVGTDLHISQGGVEVSEELWNEDTAELSIGVMEMHGRKGHLRIHVPLTYAYEKGAETVDVGNGTLLSIPVVLDGAKTIKLKFIRRTEVIQ